MSLDFFTCDHVLSMRAQNQLVTFKKNLRRSYLQTQKMSLHIETIPR